MFCLGNKKANNSFWDCAYIIALKKIERHKMRFIDFSAKNNIKTKRLQAQRDTSQHINRARAARQETGLTLDAFCSICGVTIQTLARWERLADYKLPLRAILICEAARDKVIKPRNTLK